ncbi:MAG: GNAT family N-acetyltransferase, partial [Halieaceae bacterium]|nr:GNAT family N-acetyltransferase [Halieaceae bacterium]
MMLQITQYTGAVSDELMQLLLMADPDPEAVGRYIGAAEVLVAEEAKRLVGVAVVSAEAGVAELKNLAVAEAHRGRGIAKAMIAA